MPFAPPILDADLLTTLRLRWCVAVFGLLLVSATWPLWWPAGEHPLIPWFGMLCGVPASVDRALAIGMVLSGFSVAVWTMREWIQSRQTGAASYDGQHRRGPCQALIWWFAALGRARLLPSRDCELTRPLDRGSAGASPSRAGLTPTPKSSVDKALGRGIANAVWLSCLAGSVLLDQQRFQVWAWEFWWLTLFLNLASPRVALRCCRVLVIGIYFYSAVSKLDAGFVQTQGPWLWQGMLRAFGVMTQTWEPPSQLGMLTFPVVELLVAIALCFHRMRRWGVAGAWVMHLGLLLALGPWGWDQKPGVLLWNGFFLVSVRLLFWPRREIATGVSSTLGSVAFRSASIVAFRSAKGRSFAELKTTLGDALRSLAPGERYCMAAVIGLSVWPALSGIGLCDHWPAWAVYSSRPEIVSIQIAEEQVAQLPKSLRPHVGPAQPLSPWRPISIDQWSFAQRHCPIYPQARYRLAIARHLESAYDATLRVTEYSAPDRWTGKRQSHAIENLAVEGDQRFWFNTLSRANVSPKPASLGNQLIAHTAQLSVICYVIALLLAARQTTTQDRGITECGAKGDTPRPSVAMASFWTAGLLGLTIHIACAFHYLHHWSHSAALKHTAQRTAEVTGWDWPGGLYINYAFLLFWAVDAVRVWREALGRTPVASRLWRRIVQGVFLFMMFNATVVFGPWHWTAVSVGFAGLWGFTRQSS